MTEDRPLFVPEAESRKARRPRKARQIPNENLAIYGGPANIAIQHAPNKPKRYKLDKKADHLAYERDRNFKIVIVEYGKPLSAASQRLLDYATIILTKQNEWRASNVKSTISLDFDEYAAWRCASSPKAKLRLREEIKEALKCLINMQVTFRSDKKRCCMVANIIASYTAFEDSPGQLLINFTQEFAHYTINNFISQIDPRLFGLSLKNPNIYKIGRKLCEQWHSEQMRDNGTHDRLMLTTLLKAAPDLPTLEEEKTGGRHYKQCILDPLENCLEQLVDEGILSQFEWRKKGGGYLTDEELDTCSFDELKELCLHFLMPDRPRQMSLFEA